MFTVLIKKIAKSSISAHFLWALMEDFAIFFFKVFLMLNDQILHSKDYFYVFCIYKYFWYKYGFRRVRFARVWSNVDDRNLFITAKLLKQGYRYHKIRKSQ